MNNDEPSKQLKVIEKAYLDNITEPHQLMALELLEKELQKNNSNYSIVAAITSILEKYNNRFVIELIMMPRWATKYKPYKIFQDLYTHIRIK